MNRAKLFTSQFLLTVLFYSVLFIHINMYSVIKQGLEHSGLFLLINHTPCQFF